MKCVRCGFENKNGSGFCSNCGSELKEERPNKNILILAVVCIFVIPLVMFFGTTIINLIISVNNPNYGGSNSLLPLLQIGVPIMSIILGLILLPIGLSKK